MIPRNHLEKLTVDSVNQYCIMLNTYTKASRNKLLQTKSINLQIFCKTYVNIRNQILEYD